MDISLIFAITSALIYLTGFVPYIYHVYHGRVRPHPFSWTVWAIVSIVNTIALLGSIESVSSIISPMIRTTCLMIGAFIGWTLIRKISINIFDYTCLILAWWVIVIAYFYGAQKAIIPTIMIDLLVLSPTLKKIWIDPASEDITAWITTTVSQFFLLLSLGTFEVSIIIFWIYIMSVNALVAAFIYTRSKYVNSWSYRFKKIIHFLALKNKL
jgi:hypothetical protein